MILRDCLAGKFHSPESSHDFQPASKLLCPTPNTSYPDLHSSGFSIYFTLFFILLTLTSPSSARQGLICFPEFLGANLSETLLSNPLFTAPQAEFDKVQTITYLLKNLLENFTKHVPLHPMLHLPGAKLQVCILTTFQVILILINH